jgi:HD-GYP domain-containing protein (c-di-GMP phosphodiesterase class II)
MTSPRSYAPQRTNDEAIAELKRCAGAQFDPAVVEIVCKLIAEPAWQPDAVSAPAGDLDPAQSRAG